MKLDKMNVCLDHRITGGAEFQWSCFGPNARYLDYESEHADASVIFDSVNQTVYIAEINAKRSDDMYRWVEPSVTKSYLAECKQRGIDPHEAWDDLEYVVLETEEDYLDKASAIFNGRPFDKRVDIPLEMDHQSIVKLALEAHRRDITLNQMVELILEWAIEEHQATTKDFGNNK